MSGDRRIEVTGSGDAIAGPGGYANTGVHIGDVHVWPGRPVHSGYLHQVRRIAPAELVGRERELAELEAFCTGEGGAYLWWQAPAWSGKTALLAWFALEPPARVRVVSFFVTARLAGQNTRAAFVDHVLEQLAGLLTVPEPTADTARETRLLGLLDTAAHACRGRGETLVLVVDGLDEDSAVVAGAGEDRSIAALLPVALPAGMRVVVSGRPNPPLPGDVPEHHPLRHPGVVRGLAPSAAARVVRDGMEREVARLLRDPVVGLDLLGLLAASGGGLTGDDLAGLTGLDRAEVGERLRTVAGRSFTRRGSRFRPGALPDVYLLGHEDLHVAVVDHLGERIVDHRRRLHAWADGYRDRGWPPDTPEYLLGGYHAMLVSTGEFDRALALCTDPDRQGRMLDLSGGDSQALDEIRALSAALAAAEVPDLRALARLAVRHEALSDPNRAVPEELPELWVPLGSPARALALARSLWQPSTALVRVADALLAAGHREMAAEAVRHVLEALPSDLDPRRTRAALVETLAAHGESAWAAEIGRDLDDPDWRAHALLDAAERVLAGGEPERALALARQATADLSAEAGENAEKYARHSSIARRAGDHGLGRALAAKAIAAARPSSTAGKLTVAQALVRLPGGAGWRARWFARRTALAYARRVDDSVWTAMDAVEVLGVLGHLRTAQRLADRFAGAFMVEAVVQRLVRGYSLHGRAREAVEAARIDSPSLLKGADKDPTSMLASAAVVLAEHGHHDTALAVVEELLRGGRPNTRAPRMAKALCAAGRWEAAEELALGVDGAADRAQALTVVAAALVRRGDLDRARRVVEVAEAAARSRRPSHTLIAGLVETAVESYEHGDADRADRLAPHATDPLDLARLLHARRPAGPDAPGRFTALADQLDDSGSRAVVLAWAAEAASRSGDTDQARQLLDQAEALAIRGFGDSWDLAAVGVAMVRVGAAGRAVKAALSWRRFDRWQEICTALVAAGETVLAGYLLSVLENRCEDRPELRVELVGALIEVGETAKARQIVGELVRSLPDPGTGPRPWEWGPPLAAAMATTGDLAGALRLAEVTADREERVKVELGITVALLRDDQPALAAPIAARLLHPDNDFSWYRLVGALGAHLPEVVAGGADELIAHLRSTGGASGSRAD
ncbi:MAG: hypothetical protein HOY78_45625 [Saccharothrix sp.]|nr:hypothetical protein [Saccharothrix sp.]